jgi:hypothetical protein
MGQAPSWRILRIRFAATESIRFRLAGESFGFACGDERTGGVPLTGGLPVFV